MPNWAYYAFGVSLGLDVAVVLAFVAAGNRGDARAIAGFVPDCVLLFSRLLAQDGRPLVYIGLHQVSLGHCGDRSPELLALVFERGPKLAAGEEKLVHGPPG